MPKLKTCSCTSMGDLKSSLRVLEIKSCSVLEVFDLFQKVHSATVSEIEGSSSQTLRIKPNSVLGESPCEITLDYKFLSFHNMKDLQYLEINDCCNLVSISLKTFGHLTSLKSLKINDCKELLPLDEDLVPLNVGALPSLESLSIRSCGITGKWLSLMLWHSPTLKELDISYCSQLTQLKIEEDTNLSSPSGYYPLTSSVPDGLWCIPLNLTSLKKITLSTCRHIVFEGSWKAFSSFNSLEKLTISGCPDLFSSLVHNDGQADERWLLPQSLEELLIFQYSHETLQPCFVGGLTRLKKLEASGGPCLKSLQLDSCTAMEYLRICECKSLVALEGLRSLVNLRELNVVKSPVLASLATSGEGYDCSQLSGLKSLHISELSLLTTSFCEGLSCLQRLTLRHLEEQRLTYEQQRALLLLGSLQELVFFRSSKLLDLPPVLYGLPSLKTLKINDCRGISGAAG